jgi:hypothetical protein
MFVKNRNQITVVLLLALITGILIFVLMASLRDKEIRDYEATVKAIKLTNDLVQIAPIAIQSAKPWTATPTKSK